MSKPGGGGSRQAADPDFVHENLSFRFQGGGMVWGGGWVPNFLKQIKFHISKGAGWSKDSELLL